jgi:hypothetical protein
MQAALRRGKAQGLLPDGRTRPPRASICELIDGPAPVPDGPLLDAKELSRHVGQLADGVEEAYGAVYMQSAELITVRSVKFAPTEKASARAYSSDTRVSRNPGTIRFEIGQIVAIVTGDGECF